MNYQVPGIPTTQDVSNVMTIDQKTELDAKIIPPKMKMASENPWEFNPSHLVTGHEYRFKTFKPENIMELFVPMKYYIRNAKGFGQMDFRTFLNMCPYSITIIEVMGWINEQVMEEGAGGISYFTIEFLPQRFDYDEKADKIKPKINNNNNLADNEPMEDENTDKQNDNNIVDINEIKDWKNLTEEQFERLGRKFAGMRFRLSLHDPAKKELAFYLDALLKQNKEMKKKKANRGWHSGSRNGEKLLSLFDLTLEKWKRIVVVVLGLNLKPDDNNSSVVFNTSPWNPTVAFAPAKSTQKAFKCGAIKPCCDVLNYVQRFDSSHGSITNQIKQYTFPYKGRWTYRINSADTKYDIWCHCYFPYIKRNQFAVNEEIRMMQRLVSSEDIPGECLVMGLEISGITVPALDGEIEDSEDENYQGQSKVGRGTTMYKNTSVENAAIYASNSRQEHEMTMEHFRDLTRAKFHDLTLKFKDKIGSKSYCKALNTLRRKCVYEFENHMWQQDAAVSDSMKAIIEYSNEHLRQNRNYSLPMKHTCKNLSPLAEAITQFQIALETIFSVRSVHKDVVVCMLTVWQIYMRTPFHAHMLLVGPAKAGKSFMFQLCQLLLIIGTYKALSYVTPKAKTGFAATPYKIDCMIEFFEEMLSEHLGVNKNNNKSVAGNANTDIESLIKNWLTTGKISFQRTTIINGVSVVQEAEISCNSIMMAAANISALELPDPMASRFNIVNCQIKDRADAIEQERVDLRSYIKPSHAVTLALQGIQFRMKRNQALIAYISSLIYVEILPQPNMTAGVFTILGALRLASKYLLKNTTDARNIQRLEFLMTSLILWRAVVIVFDSAISPIKDIKWEPEHILHVIPYLYSTTEDASIVLGLLSHQFEDVMSQNIIKHLSEYVLTHDVSTISVQRPFDANDPAQPLLTWSSLEPEQPKKRRIHRKVANVVTKEPVKAIDVPVVDSINSINQSYINAPIITTAVTTTTNHDNNNKKKKDDKSEVEKRLEVNILSPEAYIVATVPGEDMKAVSRVIHTAMNVKPNPIDVMDTLKRLAEQIHHYQEYGVIGMDPITQQAIFGLVSKRDYILKYNHTATHHNNNNESNLSNTIQLSKLVIKHSIGKTQRRLMRCVEEILCHPYTRNANVLYGENRNDLFYASHVINVENPSTNKKGKTRKAMRILNPTYFSTLIKQIAHASLDSIYHSFRGGKRPVINLNTIFSSEEGIELDSDLNDYAVDQFNNENYFTTDELKYSKDYSGEIELPINHPKAIKQEILKKHSEEELKKMMCYPNDIIKEREDQKKYNEENKDSKFNKEGKLRFISSKDEMMRMRAKRKLEEEAEVDEKEARLSLNVLIRTESIESKYMDENTRSSSNGSGSNVHVHLPIIVDDLNRHLITDYVAPQLGDDDDSNDDDISSFGDYTVGDDDNDNEGNIDVTTIHVPLTQQEIDDNACRIALETFEAQQQQQQQNNNNNNNNTEINMDYENVMTAEEQALAYEEEDRQENNEDNF